MASGATLVAFAHPFVGAAVAIAGVVALVAANLPSFNPMALIGNSAQ